MRYSTVFKFLAVVLCAAMLLGAVAGGAGILYMVGTDAYSRGYDAIYEDHLESQSIGYAMYMGTRYASKALGGASDPLMDDYMASHYAESFFDQGIPNVNYSTVGINYTLTDAEGNVLESCDPLDEDYVTYEFTLPSSFPYLKILRTTPAEEYNAPQVSTPQTPAEANVNVIVTPVNVVPVWRVVTLYTDGHQTEYDFGTELGSLHPEADGSVRFQLHSPGIEGFPEGDGWYVNHIICMDSGNNVVYEASTDNGSIFLGMSQDGNTIEYSLPGGSLTQEAPVGSTIAQGDYTAYDAVPEEGITVSEMTVTYEEPDGSDATSAGISSPDLIGTLFHDPEGNIRFHSSEPMSVDLLPEGVRITHIVFRTSDGTAIYEASCVGGVGRCFYDENNNLTFQGHLPGTVIPETEPAEEPQSVASLPTLAVANEKLNVYYAPATTDVLCTIEKGQEFEILKIESVEGFQWGLTKEGWVKLYQVTLLEPAVSETPGATPEGRAATVLEKTGLYSAPIVTDPLAFLEAGDAVQILQTGQIGDQDWALTEQGWVLLDALLFSIQAEPVTEETQPPVTASTEIIRRDAMTETTPEETAPEEASVSTEPTVITFDIEPVVTEAAQALPENVDTFPYYDYETGRSMIAEYVIESSPEYTVHLGFSRDICENDAQWLLLRLTCALEDYLLPLLGICLLGFALFFVYLCCAAGRKRGTDAVRAGGLNRIPLDIYLAADFFVVVWLCFMADFIMEQFTPRNPEIGLIFFGAVYYLNALLIVGFFFAFAAQVKTPGGFWWRNSFCGWSFRLLALCWHSLDDLGGKLWTSGVPLGKRFFRWLGRASIALWGFGKKTLLWLWDTGKRLLLWLWTLLCNGCRWATEKLVRLFSLLPLTWQFLSTAFVLVFILYIALRSYKIGWILLAIGLFFAVILYAASAFGILLESAGRMSRGDLDTKVNRKMLIGSFQVFADRLNDLAGVAVIAAQKQLKSERMKTELITNVSHDIKTPLTSIINYVDLLQKPHTEAQQEQYLEVLDRQSQRLKKLIDDLMEMSKASTGNLSVDIGVVDAVEAVNQSLGEFSDKLEKAQLIPVFRHPEEPLEMLADGRLVWRVMSNLLGNAVKYAMPGTRIYLDLIKVDGKVILSMKNISREALNVNADELMERFVRGDASRNTEGSGLGLNIAQSLMTLQKGQLQLLVDGDLFKVTLIFPGA